MSLQNSIKLEWISQLDFSLNILIYRTWPTHWNLSQDDSPVGRKPFNLVTGHKFDICEECFLSVFIWNGGYLDYFRHWVSCLVFGTIRIVLSAWVWQYGSYIYHKPVCLWYNTDLCQACSAFLSTEYCKLFCLLCLCHERES